MEISKEEALRRLKTLTKRERQVYNFTLQGLRTEAMALRLGVKRTTVRSYRSIMFEKLGIGYSSEINRERMLFEIYGPSLGSQRKQKVKPITESFDTQSKSEKATDLNATRELDEASGHLGKMDTSSPKMSETPTPIGETPDTERKVVHRREPIQAPDVFFPEREEDPKERTPTDPSRTFFGWIRLIVILMAIAWAWFFLVTRLLPIF